MVLKATVQKNSPEQFKRASTQVFSCKYWEIFTNYFFYSTQFDEVTIMSICRSSLLNQKHNVGWFLLTKFEDLTKACYLHIVLRGRRRGRTQAIAKRYAFHANAITSK